VISGFCSAHPQWPVRRACCLAEVSRSGYYAWLQRQRQADQRTQRQAAVEAAEARLREALEAIVLEQPGYGYRRATKELRRRGWRLNEKRVLARMRRWGLLCAVRRRWTRTTDSEHGLRVWPNLLPARRPTSLNQVWVADITYLQLPAGFCYLAAVLDAYSRKVVGWHLSRWIDAELVLAALDKALASRRPAAGWLHHSDRGVQYACRQYVDRLTAAGAEISMSRRGRPRDNAQAESFFRTLKCEEVYLQEYQDFAEAEANLARFIDDVYNERRLHSALGYLTPSEFEQAHTAQAQAA